MVKKINLLEEVNSVEELYVYKKVARMNGNILSVAQVADRTLDFHVHENSDEMFCVLEGEFQLETEDGLLPLKAGEFAVVPMNTLHRPVVTSLCKFLMVEMDGTLNKNNSGAGYSDYYIEHVGKDKIEECACVIRKAFAPVAEEFHLTQENCATNGAFITEERLEQELDYGNELYAIYQDEEMVGCMELLQGENNGKCGMEINRLSVLPKFQRKGAGAELVRYAVKQCKKRGMSQLHVGIIRENEHLKEWYDHQGFVLVEEKKFEHLPFTVGFMEYIL